MKKSLFVILTLIAVLIIALGAGLFPAIEGEYSPGPLFKCMCDSEQYFILKDGNAYEYNLGHGIKGKIVFTYVLKGRNRADVTMKTGDEQFTFEIRADRRGLYSIDSAFLKKYNASKEGYLFKRKRFWD